MSQEDLQEIYKWIDQIPLSRIKKNISRDFSDGVLMSEVVHHFFPKLVELHNYSSTNSVSQKAYNWRTLNQKCFRKIGFQLTSEDINDLVTCKRYTIERVLKQSRIQFAEYQKKISEKQAKKEHRTPNERGKSLPTYQQSPQNINNINNNNNNNKISVNDDDQDIRELLNEKDRVISHLNDKLEILELKVQKLEQLLRLKDGKIEALQSRLSQQV